MKAFVREARRRRIFRVAALYLAGGFGVLEAVDILQGAMRLPAGFLPSVTVLVILGLPLALAGGWIFDITRGGVKRTSPAPAADAREGDSSVPASFPRRWPAASLILVTALAVSAAGWTVRGMSAAATDFAAADPGAAGATAGPRDAAPDANEFASIAVLPFLNLSGDPADDYFGDGLAEEIGNVLSRVDGLRVAARTSAFAFRGREIDAKQIGDTLGVGMLLEGSVRRAGERVRVGAQLIRAADGLSLWSDTWDRELTMANVFEIQDEITRSIAGELERELAPESGRLAERRTSDLAAYDMYLLGRHHWATRTPDGLRQAIELFEQALARDSTYALAWAGLADAWEARPFFDRSISMNDAEPVARAAALRGLALAPELAEAHAALGVIHSDYDYDYEQGIRHLERAVELNPNHAQAWSWLCVARTMAGDPSAGLAACDQAVTLDPLYAVPRAQRALALMSLERHEDALAALQNADDLGPLVWVLAVAVRLELGRLDEIENDLVRTGAALGLADPGRMRTVAEVIRARARGEGTEAAAAEALDVLRDLETAGRVGFLELAPLYAWIGARSEALRVFDEAVIRRDPWLPFAGRIPSFDSLRDSSAFARALDSLGIPNDAAAT
ncbi:MAG: tetratricopeptide repeat protein [Gemmatimonadota bacterium]